MAYKAKYNFGDYKKGDIVPDEKAELYIKMYVESPVELSGKKESKPSKPKEEEIEYDLNGDGKFDKTDKSIAGKVLRRKTKKSKKK